MAPRRSASLADVLISCWRNKYDFKFWRPVTAIALAATIANHLRRTD